MVTLIMNYFVDLQLRSEIKDYPSVEAALERVKELRDSGIELSQCHFGIYQHVGDKMVEITFKGERV